MKIFENPNARVKSKYGQYSIAVVGNIVAVSATGIAGKHAIERYSHDMMETIQKFKGDRWAFMGFLHGSALLTKDAEFELQKSIQWRAKHGMTLGALITGDTTIESLVNSQFARIYEKANVPLGVFGDEESAIKWLQQQGFSFEPR